MVRADLPAGLRAAQAGHALIQWVLVHGEPPDNLVLLEVPDERALIEVLSLARREKFNHVEFCEPDLDDETTAVALGPQAWRRLSSLPLAFRRS